MCCGRDRLHSEVARLLRAMSRCPASARGGDPAMAPWPGSRPLDPHAERHGCEQDQRADVRDTRKRKHRIPLSWGHDGADQIEPRRSGPSRCCPLSEPHPRSGAHPAYQGPSGSPTKVFEAAGRSGWSVDSSDTFRRGPSGGVRWHPRPGSHRRSCGRQASPGRNGSRLPDPSQPRPREEALPE